MHRRSLATGLVAVLVSLTMVLAGPTGRAAAEDDYERGPTSGTINFGAADDFGVLPWIAGKAGWWVSCDVAGYWTVKPSTGEATLHVAGGCRRGWSMNDGDLVFITAVEGCGSMTVNVGNVDDPDETANFDVAMVSPSTGCGASATLCGAVDGEGEVCKAWSVGAPPESDPDQSYYNPTAGCSIWAPLQPWVTDYQPVAVTGGWAWRSTAMVSVPQFPAGSTLGAYTPVAQLIVAFTGGPTSASGDAYTSVSSPVSSGSYSWVSANLYVNSGGWQRKTQRTVTITGPTLTTAQGTGAPNWQWGGVGVLWTASSTFGLTIDGSSKPSSRPSRPSLADINANFAMYGGHHDPERCHFWWGNDVWPTDASGYDTPAGPLVLRDNATPPAYDPPVTTPPIIHVGPEEDCPEGADACIDPDVNAPDDPTAIPDPEDSSCDFDIAEPSTWGGQIICAIVAIGKAIVGMLGDLLGFLGGLVQALLDGLMGLFVPDADHLSEELESVKDSWSESTIGNWLNAFDDATPTAPPGGCTGPHVSVPILDSTMEAEPLNACSGAAATYAGYCRAFLTAVIVFFGGLGGLRILGKGFGWSPGIGGGDGS